MIRFAPIGAVVTHISVAVAAALLGLPCSASAAPPHVKAAVAVQQGGGWHIEVTLAHPDTGWDHYADGWRVLDAAGTELGRRVLHHPHETEQPFTRGLGGVAIAPAITRIFIEPRCSVDGWSGETVAVELRRDGN